MTDDTIDMPRPAVFLICDIESTGLTKPVGVVEVAIRQIDPETLATVREWYSLIDPEKDIEPGAQEIHGISAEMVADEPTIAEFIEHRLCGAFDDVDITFIAHNVPYDLPPLAGIGTVTRTVCTLSLSRHLVKDSTNHKLQTLREHFGFPANEAHRAMADVATTHRVLGKLLELSGRTLEQLAATTEQTYHTMPFGKHKGLLMFHVPKPYLAWLVAQPGLDPNLLKSVQKAMAMK